ncbi:ribonuclease E inhibitor RraB [Volucribacter amazonae]|uniref:Uncharacterized protein n=1 Tax=Volucribacter amazonae TaxID=256731 RepID=A0A9X4P967_9PAST|nr:ribonuclease E inhibitor RraB [Volucribacter amazonae]MDG6894052.1 hypothetical protein [Volucribacter amazonae]
MKSFYTNYAKEVIDILNGFDSITDIKQQQDPQASIYFDFLLPSPLELKLNATEEILTILQTNGDDLSERRPVEHIFHFKMKTAYNVLLIILIPISLIFLIYNMVLKKKNQNKRKIIKQQKHQFMLQH